MAGKLTTAAKVTLGVAALGAAGGLYVATQDAPQAHPGNCTRVSPTTGKQECRGLLVMLGETECPAGWVPIDVCPPLGTVEFPPMEPTPGPTVAPAASPTPGGSPIPTSTPAPLPGFSLALQWQGRVVLITCPSQACWIDGRTANWTMVGPWELTIKQEAAK